MTPAEHARLIDKQEFEEASKAALQRALAYAKQLRKQEKQKVRGWIEDQKQPAQVTFVYAGRPPQPHTINGVSRTFNEWAKHLGIAPKALASRRRRFGSLEAAVAAGPNQRPRAGVVSDFGPSEGDRRGEHRTTDTEYNFFRE